MHCAAGESRSPAAAIAIKAAWQKKYLGHCDPQACIDQIVARRPLVTPNPVMVNRTDQLLGLNGDLINAVYRYPFRSYAIYDLHMRRGKSLLYAKV